MNGQREIYTPRAVLQRRMWYSIEYENWDNLVAGRISGEELLCKMILGSCDDLFEKRIKDDRVKSLMKSWEEKYKGQSDFLQRRRHDSHKGRDLSKDVIDMECHSRKGIGKRVLLRANGLAYIKRDDLEEENYEETDNY